MVLMLMDGRSVVVTRHEHRSSFRYLHQTLIYHQRHLPAHLATSDQRFTRLRSFLPRGQLLARFRRFTPLSRHSNALSLLCSHLFDYWTNIV